MPANNVSKLLGSILLLTLMAVAGCSAETASALPDQAAQVLEEGEPVAFTVCNQAADWQRPPESQQRQQWWEDNRYLGLDTEVLEYPWTHEFLLSYGHASIENDLVNLSGLWTLPDQQQAGCFDPAVDEAVARMESAELWSLMYEVQGIKHLESDYVITVAPLETGVQFLSFSRPDGQEPLTLYIVDESGQLVETIQEEQGPYWPNP